MLVAPRLALVGFRQWCWVRLYDVRVWWALSVKLRLYDVHVWGGGTLYEAAAS